MTPNYSPRLISGTTAERPLATSENLATLYYDTTTKTLYVVELVAGVKTWVLATSANTPFGIPVDQIVFGSPTTSLTSSPNLKFDPLTNTFMHAAPASPHYFVASTGSDSNPGTALLPLAHVAEALRRLDISRWGGEPIITLVDTVNEGVNPLLNVPAAPAGASDIRFEGVFTPVVPSHAATGGTAALSTPALGTVTSTLVTVKDQYNGLFLRFLTGALANKRTVIDQTDNAGKLTWTDNLPAPANGDLFTIEDLVGKLQWGGRLRIEGPGKLLVHAVDFDLGDQLLYSTIVQFVACRFSTALPQSYIAAVRNGVLYDNVTGVVFPEIPLPAGVLPCGSRYDGKGNVLVIGSPAETIESLSKFYFSSPSMAGVFISMGDFSFGVNMRPLLSMTNFGGYRSCSIQASNTDVTFMESVDVSGVDTLDTPGAHIALFGCTLNLLDMDIDGYDSGAVAPDTVIYAIRTSGTIQTPFIGANTTAHSLVADQNTQIGLIGGAPANVGTNAAVAVLIGLNAGTSWANANGGTNALATDVGNAHTRFCRVGPTTV